MLRQGLEALDAMANNWDDSNDDDPEDATDSDEVLQGINDVKENGWYPFTHKEHIVALLIIGSTRSLLSRLQYQRIRSILQICKVKLPAWGSLRALKNRLQSKMGLDICARDSPTGKPLFGLKVQTIIQSELANPIVSPHFVFLPELPVNVPINRLSQSQKWREDYPPSLRVQMVEYKSIHFYIYEPVQVVSAQLFVPIFFYQQADEVMAKCLRATVETASPIQGGFNVMIDQEPSFHSAELFTINVKDFWRPFTAVKLDDGSFLSSHCGNHMYQRTSAGHETVPLMNPWRIKAQGKIIRHIPLTIYSDDTSGNVSKKYNKHMSIYFTLSGLSPDQSNQEYNTHFLATTNCATALDLFDQVVDEINDLGRNGFTTYDHSLGTDVCAMVSVLCHLGDSPMHAEISNTTNPANTLTPCRMCDIQVERQVQKKTDRYVRDFLGLDENGDKAFLPNRNWNVTRERTREVWRAAQRYNSKKQVDDLTRQYGLRDSVNDHFIRLVWNAQAKLTGAQVDILRAKLEDEWGNRLFNPMLRLDAFDGHSDTPVEILHVVLLGVVKYLFRDTMKTIKPGKAGGNKYNDLSARWRSFNTKGLKIPPIQPNTLIQFFQSLVGKEFRTVLQSVPFVIYEHITEKMRHLWTALCLLGSFVFQTAISDIDTYLTELDNHVDMFLNQLVSISAQWVNKPKFHMLIHLKYSIRRFGPPCLVATEKFESFNGKTRDASVHSNRQSPGNDIAYTFLTGLMLRILLSGTSFFDRDLQSRVVAGHHVRSLLSKIPELAQAMGLNPNVGRDQIYTDSGEYSKIFISMHYLMNMWFHPGRKQKQGDLPLCLEPLGSEIQLEEVQSVTLPSQQKIETQDFVVVRHYVHMYSTRKLIARSPGQRRWPHWPSAVNMEAGATIVF
ncbi:hypothetical protein DFH28DRAFT_1048547 [Melampsora americana]|nr:hypothetical protein DFH28DRAFT_1048547 [Melampsora americana]